MLRHLCKFIFIVCISFYTIIASAQQSNVYTFDKAVSVPGDGGYDYLFIDQVNNKLFVSHGATVNVIDIATETVVATISDMKGVHGIATVNSAGKGFISDGKANSVVVFDINTFKKIKTIKLSGKKPDAIMYDPFSNKVFAFNGGSDNVSVIDVDSLKETNVIPLDGAPEFAVSDGRGKIYDNLEDKNLLKTIDSKSLKVINTWPLTNCLAPSGLAIDTVNKRLFTVGADSKNLLVLDAESGKIINTLPIGSGVDAVVFDEATKLILASCGDGVTTIIKQESADKYVIVQKLSTPKRARTMALDTKTHKIYLSVADFVPGARTVVPNSFKVLIYKMIQ